MPDAARDEALLGLLAALRARDYRFVTTTPATHARVVARSCRAVARSIEDMLGWSLPFDPAAMPADIVALLAAADALEPAGAALLRATLRVSRVRGGLYLHSAYPTHAADAVFLGPDSYRFADLIAGEVAAQPPRIGARIVDIGTGSGVGGLVAAACCPDAALTMTDLNPRALRLARINAAAAGIVAHTHLGSDLTGVAEGIDVALANPPFIIDDAGRAYRHGGGMHGAAVALAMTEDALARLAPGGRLILYTGSAIVDGGDALHEALAARAAAHGCDLRYRQIDPDVFGEELDRPGYEAVDRIALVAAVATRAD